VGKVIISFDFEIGWGDITNGDWKRREHNGVYKRLRHVLPDLLSTMDAFECVATWATVGAMIEAPKDRDFSYLTDHQRDIVERGMRTGQSDTFDGTDLFEKVISTNTNHKVACHSFAHIPFDFNGVDEKFVQEDLRRFVKSLKQYNLTTNRFVFPENTEGFYMEILKLGFKTARVSADNYFKNRYLFLLSLAIIPPPPCKEVYDCSGVTKHYGSMLFNDRGMAYRIPILERRVKLGLKNVVEKDHDLHIWAHPFNFAESDYLLDSFQRMLKKIATLRDQGKLSIEFM